MSEEDLVEFEELVGTVEAYDAQSGRATLRIDHADLPLGALVRILGADAQAQDLVTIEDLLIAEAPVEKAARGTTVTLPVPRPVTVDSEVYLVPSAEVSA